MKFIDEKKCCGCGLCAKECPFNAIEMIDGEFGSRVAKINTELCINCGKCDRVCPIFNAEHLCNPVKEVYGGASSNTNLQLSASGGGFASIARNIISEGGVCYGASMSKENDVIRVKHIRIDSEKELYRVLGSKYVQSQVVDTFDNVKNDLKHNLKVLYSGTPCQIAALKLFLNKEYDNLFCVDLICHGVPSENLLNDYLKTLENKNKVVEELVFRDKSYGWGSVGSIKYKGKNKKPLYVSESSYYHMFESSISLRKSCYSCPFAKQDRVGDITLGDFWGVNAIYGDKVEKKYNTREGISCILINSYQGQKCLNLYGKNIELFKSSIDLVSRSNSALKEPAVENKERNHLLKIYSEDGYSKVEQCFNDNKNWKYYIRKIINRIPYKLKLIIHKVL